MRRVARRLTRRSGLAAVFPPKCRRLVEQIPRGALAIDAGANVGNVTGALARRKLDVVAFEPHPSAFAVLAGRFADTPNVTCIRKAVAATDGPARLHLHAGSDRDALAVSAASSLYAGKRNVERDDWILVEAVDLDAFIAGLDRPVALLKLDVEGAGGGRDPRTTRVVRAHRGDRPRVGRDARWRHSGAGGRWGGPARAARERGVPARASRLALTSHAPAPARAAHPPAVGQHAERVIAGSWSGAGRHSD